MNENGKLAILFKNMPVRKYLFFFYCLHFFFLFFFFVYWGDCSILLWLCSMFQAIKIQAFPRLAPLFTFTFLFIRVRRGLYVQTIKIQPIFFSPFFPLSLFFTSTFLLFFFFLFFFSQTIPVSSTGVCAVCDGKRFYPCTWCGGNKKSMCANMGEQAVKLRCTCCNENGLMRCTACLSEDNEHLRGWTPVEDEMFVRSSISGFAPLTSYFPFLLLDFIF